MRFNTKYFRLNTELVCHAGKHRDNGYFFVSRLYKMLDENSGICYHRFELGWRHVEISKINRYRKLNNDL